MQTSSRARLGQDGAVGNRAGASSVISRHTTPSAAGRSRSCAVHASARIAAGSRYAGASFGRITAAHALPQGLGGARAVAGGSGALRGVSGSGGGARFAVAVRPGGGGGGVGLRRAGRRAAVAVSAVFEKFSERSIKAVMISQQVAKELGAAEVRQQGQDHMRQGFCCNVEKTWQAPKSRHSPTKTTTTYTTITIATP